MCWILVQIPLHGKITLSYKEVGLSGFIQFILEIKFLNWHEAAQILPNIKNMDWISFRKHRMKKLMIETQSPASQYYAEI